MLTVKNGFVYLLIILLFAASLSAGKKQNKTVKFSSSHYRMFVHLLLHECSWLTRTDIHEYVGSPTFM